VLPEHAAPLYLRDRVAFTVAERALGEGGNPRALAPGKAALVPMTLADLPEALEIERAVQSFPWTFKNFEDALAAGYEAWVLRQGADLLGFCIAMQAPDVAHILVIAVARDHQRQGYAHQLLGQITRSAQAQSAEGLLLEVRPSNDAALAFYAREGFIQIGVRRAYYPAGRGEREDAYVLKKTFDQS
jgi:tRNA threonylcarbamoyladenosine biosynthesis protein TsaB